MKFPQKLTDKLQKRTENNALRQLGSERSLIDFASNDYLGVSLEVTEVENGFKMENKQFFIYTENPPSTPVKTAVFCRNLRSEIYQNKEGQLMHRSSATWTPIDK